MAKTCLSGRGLSLASPAQPDVFPSSLEAASRQREEVSSAYMKVCEMVMGMGGRAGVPLLVCTGPAAAYGGVHAIFRAVQPLLSCYTIPG